MHASTRIRFRYGPDHAKLTALVDERENPMAQMETDRSKEAMGWLSLIAVMLLFPALFFLCVFFPIWVGWTPQW